MNHLATPDYWACLHVLPPNIQHLANKNYTLLTKDPSHPSLPFKKIGNYYSVRIGIHYRALGLAIPEGVLWFWIGTHAEYDKLLA